jgi:hypothetical protein
MSTQIHPDICTPAEPDSFPSKGHHPMWLNKPQCLLFIGSSERNFLTGARSKRLLISCGIREFLIELVKEG